MALLRGIGRVAPLVAAGVAAGWYLRRQGLLGGPSPTELPWPPPEPAPAPAAPPVAETKMAEVVESPPEPPPVVAETKMAEVVEPPPAPPPEPEPEPEAEPIEAVSDASDVTSVVDDLLTTPPGEQEIVDAEVVEDDDPRDLDERVQAALDEVPGLLAGSVQIETYRGAVWLRGELESADTIDDAERRVAAVRGVTEVRNLLHLRGTPPPAS